MPRRTDDRRHSFPGEIRFDGVEFAYEPERAGAARISTWTSRPGQTVALVGPTGAGKSTLLWLIPRLYDPTAGAVRIDGTTSASSRSSRCATRSRSCRRTAMLFGGTIRENIAYGKPDATDAEIEAAARAARIHDFITALPDGLRERRSASAA